MITDDGTIIRTPADGIPIYGRTASGVIIMRTGNSRIVNFTVTEKAEEEDDADESADGSDLSDSSYSSDKTDGQDVGEADTGVYQE